jgi:hypothetical protein
MSTKRLAHECPLQNYLEYPKIKKIQEAYQQVSKYTNVLHHGILLSNENKYT